MLFLDWPVLRRQDKPLKMQYHHFGTYPQTSVGTDSTPVKWRVLQKEEAVLFLLSEYILDCRPFHDKNEDTHWQQSGIHRWLNNTFYHAAFTAAEKKQVIDTAEGRVFLLSAEEVKAFTTVTDGPARRRTAGTAFAKQPKAGGCHLYVYDKDMQDDYVVEDGVRHGCSWWWTRSQAGGQPGSRATFIGPRSNIKTYGQVDIRRYGVRPAIKIILP